MTYIVIGTSRITCSAHRIVQLLTICQPSSGRCCHRQFVVVTFSQGSRVSTPPKGCTKPYVPPYININTQHNRNDANIANIKRLPRQETPPHAVIINSISRMQLVRYATRTTPHGASRLVQAMSAWSVKTRRAPPQHCRDASVYVHTTTVMHDMSPANYSM